MRISQQGSLHNSNKYPSWKLQKRLSKMHTEEKLFLHLPRRTLVLSITKVKSFPFSFPTMIKRPYTCSSVICTPFRRTVRIRRSLHEYSEFSFEYWALDLTYVFERMLIATCVSHHLLAAGMPGSGIPRYFNFTVKERQNSRACFAPPRCTVKISNMQQMHQL